MRNRVITAYKSVRELQPTRKDKNTKSTRNRLSITKRQHMDSKSLAKAITQPMLCMLSCLIRLLNLLAKKNPKLHFPQALFTKESGLSIRETVTEFKTGKTALDIRVNGNRVYLMDVEKLLMLMEIVMRDNGLTARQADLECICIELEQFIRVFGLKIYNKEEGTNNGVIKAATKESIKKVKRKGLGSTGGQTEVITKDSG